MVKFSYNEPDAIRVPKLNTVARLLDEAVRLSAHYKVKASAADNAAAFVDAASLAASTGVPLLIDGGPGTTYTLTHATSFAYITASADLVIESDGATLYLAGTGTRGIFGITAPTRASALTLAADTLASATSITLGAGVVAANAIAVGDVVYIDAPGVFPATTRANYPYQKQAVRTVQSITGDTLYLKGPPLTFAFTTAEVTITVYQGVKLTLRGLRMHLGTGGRFDIRGLAEADIEELTQYGDADWSSGTAATSVDGLQIYSCCNVRIDKPRLSDLRYGIAPSLGSYSVRITDIVAERTRHPVDPQAWASDVVVDGFTFNNNYNSIAGHAGFACGYQNGVAHDNDPSLGQRGSGNWAKNIEVYGINGVSGTASTTLMSYTAGYEYLFGESSRVSDCIYDAVIAPNTAAGFSEMNDLYLTGRSRYLWIGVDGISNKVTRIHVGNEVETASASDIRRIEQRQPGLGRNVQTTEETWSTAATVTSITNANPAVVTVTAHGFGNQQRITIAGVTGMTEANGTWTITWIDANSFSIALNATALAAAAGAMTAARAGHVLRADTTAGIGSKIGKFRLRLRDVSTSEFSRQASLVFPVRIFPDPNKVSTSPVRFGIIRVLAESRHDGLRVREFGFHATGTSYALETTGTSKVILAGSVGATLDSAISGVSGSYSGVVDANYVQFDLTVSGISSGGSGGQPLPIVDVEIETYGQ